MDLAYQRYFAEVYDRLMEDMPHDDWQRFIREAWQRYDLQPRTVVDLGCGTGRHTVLFAQDGLEMVGIDLSEYMLTIAQQQSEQFRSAIQASGGSVSWIQQDMRDWDIGRDADSVISLCDGINYLLSEDDVRSVFARTCDGLRDGGLFVFDVLTRYQFEQYVAGQPYTYDDEDIAYIWYSDWDDERRMITHELTMFVQQDAEADFFIRFQETHQQRAYDREQLSLWLKEAGFRHVECFADFSWRDVTDQTSRMFVCAIK